MQHGNKTYGGLDLFKFLASILVMSVHIGPFLGTSREFDYILTGILARIAVPFFMMTTGFFIVRSENTKSNNERIYKSIRKILGYYLIATLIYLPVNMYANQLSNLSLLSCIRLLFFDGTFYHLWYFPSMIIGLIISVLLMRTLNNRWAIIIAFLLFIIGLLGDSYYGISSNIDGLKQLYENGFNLFSYTRNGLFMAPIFICIGANLKSNNKLSKKMNFIIFILFLIVMITEGLLLKQNNSSRHNSMYLFLIPTMIFLFEYLKRINTKNHPALRIISTWIYILHPFIIILIRGLAKGFHLEEVLIDNHLCLFVGCACISICLSYSVYLLFYRKKIENKTDDRAWISISKKALINNLSELKSCLPSGKDIMPVLKANAYGHDAVLVAKVYQQQGIHSFCVATIDEGIELRKGKIRGEILILGYTAIERMKELKKYNFTQTIVDYEYAKQLEHLTNNIKVQVAVDTGMRRLGIDAMSIDEISDVLTMKHLLQTGIFSHLCCSDMLDSKSIEFTKFQINNFDNCIQKLKQKNIGIPKVHIQASAGLVNYSILNIDTARVGIALYGPFFEMSENRDIHLQPVLTLKARVATIKKIVKGEGIGYGLSFIAPCDMTIATITIGYADGLSRSLSCGVGQVLIQGQRVNILGNICMDQCMIDITNVHQVHIFEEVTVIGREYNEEITVYEIAKRSNTIPNEVLTRLQNRLPRILID